MQHIIHFCSPKVEHMLHVYILLVSLFFSFFFSFCFCWWFLSWDTISLVFWIVYQSLIHSYQLSARIEYLSKLIIFPRDDLQYGHYHDEWAKCSWSQIYYYFEFIILFFSFFIRCRPRHNYNQCYWTRLNFLCYYTQLKLAQSTLLYTLLYWRQNRFFLFILLHFPWP